MRREPFAAAIVLLDTVNEGAANPWGVALSPDGKQLMVPSYYSGEALALDPNRCRVLRRIDLGSQPAPDAARHGEFVFHDGGAVILKEVVTTKDPEDKHGRTSHRSEEEIDALAEYLLSL
jgi:2-polyprenyl-6-methoxyphenol hydroxylase-like FAD-dependent oxidoreductase